MCRRYITYYFSYCVSLPLLAKCNISVLKVSIYYVIVEEIIIICLRTVRQHVSSNTSILQGKRTVNGLARRKYELYRTALTILPRDSTWKPFKTFSAFCLSPLSVSIASLRSPEHCHTVCTTYTMDNSAKLCQWIRALKGCWATGHDLEVKPRCSALTCLILSHTQLHLDNSHALDMQLN